MKLKKQYLFLAVLLLSLPFIFGMSNYYVTLLILINIYAIAAISLNLLTGYGGMISLGSVAFIQIGAYTAAIAVSKFSLPFWMTIPLSGVVAGIVGFIIGFPAVRLSGHFLAVVTLGLGLSINPIVMNWDSLTNGYNGISIQVPEYFKNEVVYYYVVLVVTVIVTWLSINIIRSVIGRGFIAIRESEVSAESSGINIARYKILLFTVSSFFTGISGGLYAYMSGYVSPTDFNLFTSFFLLAMIIVGGLASIPGAIIGAVVFTVIPHFTNSYVGLTYIVIGTLMILTIIFLPHGLVTIPSRIKSLIKSRNNVSVLASKINSEEGEKIGS